MILKLHHVMLSEAKHLVTQRPFAPLRVTAHPGHA